MKKLKAIPRLRSSILIDELASTPLTLLDDLHRVPVGPTNQNALCEAQDDDAAGPVVNGGLGVAQADSMVMIPSAVIANLRCTMSPPLS